MKKQSQKFGDLLSEGIRIVAARQERTISAIEDELGYTIGRKGGSVIRRYRRGFLPPKEIDIERLSKWLVIHGQLDESWLDAFLESTNYSFIDQLMADLFQEQSVPDALEYLASQPKSKPGLAPPAPSMLIGREYALSELKSRLILNGSKKNHVQAMTSVRGWPGVGKTTIAAALAHDSEISEAYPDGILWVSLGPEPELLSLLSTWGVALGNKAILNLTTTEEVSSLLVAMLREKRYLLIVDDVWATEHAKPFIVGGKNCATLITTRLNEVAHHVTPAPENVYRLPVLTDDDAIILLEKLAPSVVKQYPAESRTLLKALEGLPLAIQVAGRLLHVEAQYGFSIVDLLAELSDGKRLLDEKAPIEQADLIAETTPTVAVLLRRSTKSLSADDKERFAILGVFAPKPATFDLKALEFMWQVDDPKPIVRIFVDRGLLESVPAQERFQMHALLVKHANSLFMEGSV